MTDSLRCRISAICLSYSWRCSVHIFTCHRGPSLDWFAAHNWVRLRVAVSPLLHNSSDMRDAYYRYIVLSCLPVIWAFHGGGSGYRNPCSVSLRAGWSGDRISVGARFFRTCPDRPWGTPSPLYNE